MKKKIIYSSALAALLCASSIAFAGGPEEVIIPIEDYFSGFYVGGTGSVHHADMDGSSQVNLTQNITILGRNLPAGNVLNYDTSGASVDGYGGVQGGFGWTFGHRWYLGIQGFGEFGSQNSTSTNNSTLVNVSARNNTITDVATISSSTTTRVQNDYGVAGKLGYLLFPRTMVYGKVGAVWADIKVTNSFTATNNFNARSLNPNNPNFINVVATAGNGSNNEDNKCGLLLGLGAEQIVYQDWVSLNLEYDYANYGTVNTGPVQLFGNIAVNTGQGSRTINNQPIPLPFNTQASGDATVNSFLVGVNFYFGRHWMNFV